jgi:hypothetical protein
MDAWPMVERYMAMAAEATNGRYVALDILDALLNFNHDLWVVFDETGVRGALVTAIKQYPSKRYLELAFIGGENGHAWKDQMLSVLRSWAKDHSCDGLESNARLGWAKIFKGDGYRPMWQVFELPLEDVGSEE